MVTAASEALFHRTDHEFVRRGGIICSGVGIEVALSAGLAQILGSTSVLELSTIPVVPINSPERIHEISAELDSEGLRPIS